MKEETDQHMMALVAKYIEGSLSEAEAQALFEWTNQSDEHRNEFTNSLKIHQKMSHSSDRYNHAQAKNRFDAYVGSTPKRSLRSMWLRYGSVAAILLGVLLYTTLFTKNEVPKMTSVLVENSTEKQGEQLSLPDRSTIFLGEKASIEYANDFGTKDRAIRLHGNAFFEVQRDTLRPFRITTSLATIEVLGTSFYIDEASETGETVVSVASGTVRVASLRSGETTILTHGLQCRVDSMGQIVSEEVFVPASHEFWFVSDLSFENESVGDVFSTLSRYYGVEFKVADDELSKIQIVFSIDGASLDETLELLSIMLDASFTMHNDIVLFTKNVL